GEQTGNMVGANNRHRVRVPRVVGGEGRNPRLGRRRRQLFGGGWLKIDTELHLDLFEPHVHVLTLEPRRQMLRRPSQANRDRVPQTLPIDRNRDRPEPAGAFESRLSLSHGRRHSGSSSLAIVSSACWRWPFSRGAYKLDD